MRSLQPPTILHLIFVGYLVVLLPLLFAIARSAASLDKSANAQRDQLTEFVNLTQEVEVLGQALISYERLIQQYYIVRKPELLELLGKRSKVLFSTLNSLEDEGVRVSGLGPLLHNMRSHLQMIHVSYQKHASGESLVDELDRFELLNAHFVRLEDLVQAYFKEQIKEASSAVKQTRFETMVLVFAIFPITGWLMISFARRIAKPIDLIKKAIQTMGEGSYQKLEAVGGPRDFQVLATQFNWLAEQLSKADSEKKRFLRHISHELKTPLSSLKEGSELLLDEVPGSLSKEQRQVVEIIHRGVGSLHGLINNLLDYNLLTKKPHVQLSRFSLSSTLQEITQVYQLSADRKKLEVIVAGPEVELYSDRSRLKAALDNLISNAIHYSHYSGRVEITWEIKNSNLIINVKDDGPGIARHEREKVFSPFYQGKAKKQGPLKGTGLGLSVAKECVEALQGSIAILDSRIGSWFQLVFPEVLSAESV